jgi:predicted Fe-Mo cluster-binding NifX family protein
MADKKISELPLIQNISGSTVVVPMVHDGTTIQIPIERLSLFTSQFSATTASNTFIGNQTVNGNVVITGKLTAQELFTEITSASIIFESGSTIFGNTADDIHTFTGTININGNVVGNAPLDFTSQSLNIATGSYNRLYDVTSSVHFTTASLNIQTGSQGNLNAQIGIATSSLNFATGALNIATSSLNFASGALEIASGSYNRFYQATASIHSTTSSLNQATSSLNFASGALEIATGSYNRFYDMTSSVHFTTQSLNVQTGSQELINVQNSIVSSSLNFASASINFTTGALNSFTGSIISQTNTIATFTSSVNFATSSLNVQTGSQDLVNLRISSTTGSINTTTSSFDSVFLRISSVTGSMNTQSSSQDLVNYQNSIVTSSFRNEIGGIEAYTASLKSAIVVNGTNVRIIGELTASRIYTEFITSSVLFVTGSNIIGDQSTDKHEFTGSVNINDTLFIKGQAIGTGQLNAFTGSQIGKDFTLSIVTSSIDAHILKQATQTGSQDLVNLGISTYTGSQNVINSSVDAHILKQATQTGSQDLVNYNISVYTGSQNVINTSVNSHILAQSTQTGSQDLVNLGISTYTGSQNVINTSIDAHILKQATQTGSQDLVNLGISTFTGSLRSEVNLIEAYTASLKGAAIVSSSQQITNYYKFAETASANTVFYGNVTASGNLHANQLYIGGATTASGLFGASEAVVQNELGIQFADATGTYMRLIANTANSNTAIVAGAFSGAQPPLDLIAGGITAISVKNDGGVNFGGALTASIYKVNNGGGIDFSATSNSAGTMTSELLNDYEEGTWTPTLTSDTSPSGVTYSGRVGKYTKIGRVVHIEFVIGLTSKGTGTGDVFISGLPFTVANDMASGEPACVGITLCQGLNTSVYLLSGFANNNSTDIQLRKTTAASTTFPGSYINTTDISDSLYIQGSVTYHV